MSRLTNYAENKLLDWLMRGQSLSLPANWSLALGSAASDSAFTELAYTSYARVAKTRNLTNFSGTQGVGSVLASTGTTHRTVNSNAWDFVTPGSSGGSDAAYVGLFDASSGGNCWIWFQLSTPIPIVNGTAISLAAGQVVFELGVTGGMSDYLSNKLIDLIFRGQAFTPAASLYAALMTAVPSNAGGGTEVGGGVGYDRVELVSSMATWGGTSAPGSTVASAGTDGTISNNDEFVYAISVDGDWGDLAGESLYDSPSAGNLYWWSQFAQPQTITTGMTPPSHPADTMEVTLA